MAHRHAPGQAPSAEQGQRNQCPVDKTEKVKASLRAKVEHALQVVECQFHAKARHGTLRKNTTQLISCPR